MLNRRTILPRLLKNTSRTALVDRICLLCGNRLGTETETRLQFGVG